MIVLVERVKNYKNQKVKMNKIESNDKLLATLNEATEVTGKALIAGIPILGGPIIEIIDSVQSNRLAARHEEWLRNLNDRLTKIEYKVDELGNSEFFTSSLIKATEIASKSHEKEKRDYLANALINSIDLESSMQTTVMIYYNLIDAYTILHIKVLDFFNNPSQHTEEIAALYGTSSPGLLLENCREFRKVDKDLLKKVVNDLQNDGLINISNGLNTMMTVEGAMKPRTTKLGKGLLLFISDV